MGEATREELLKQIAALRKRIAVYRTGIERRNGIIKRLRSRVEQMAGRLAAEGIEPPPEPAVAQRENGSGTGGNKAPKPAAFAKNPAPSTNAEPRGSAAAPNPEAVNDADNAAGGPADPAAAKDTGVRPSPAPAVPSGDFRSGPFLDAVLDGEEEADEARALIEEWETCGKDRKNAVAQSLGRLHWRMAASMGKRLLREDLPREKRLFIRFGMLDERLMEGREDLWNHLCSETGQPGDTGVYYLDEWLEAVAMGRHRFSSIDEIALGGSKPDHNATGAKALGYELLNAPQMHRMTVGARANPVSVLMGGYCRDSRDNPPMIRERVIEAFRQIKRCDTRMLLRKRKGGEYEVQPIFVILPGYGQLGGCWEPWNPGRKKDTGPRICVPAFPPRSGLKAMCRGMADYRWEYAKADAMHYWMTEGLAGNWLSLFSPKEQRMDLKEVFIETYFHWVRHESNRIPKIDKRFREFFWHNIPFGGDVKQGLMGSGLFTRLIELDEAKKRREEEESLEIERIRAERESHRAKRLANANGD